MMNKEPLLDLDRLFEPHRIARLWEHALGFLAEARVYLVAVAYTGGVAWLVTLTVMR